MLPFEAVEGPGFSPWVPPWLEEEDRRRKRDEHYPEISLWAWCLDHECRMDWSIVV